jgi:hypothetical protein
VEHGQNVSIVACGNALNQVISPTTFLKNYRYQPELSDDMPPGSTIKMTDIG